MSTQAPGTSISISISIVVEAPIERAFRVFTEDFGAFKPRDHYLLAVEIAETVFEPRWAASVTGGHIDGEGPHGVGARCLTTRRIGLAERAVTSEITHIDPPRRRGVRGIDGPVRAIVDVTVGGLDGGRRTRVTIELDFTGHGIGRLLVPLVVRRGARREMPANLNMLRERLERSDSQTATSRKGRGGCLWRMPPLPKPRTDSAEGNETKQPLPV